MEDNCSGEPLTKWIHSEACEISLERLGGGKEGPGLGAPSHLPHGTGMAGILMAMRHAQMPSG